MNRKRRVMGLSAMMLLLMFYVVPWTATVNHRGELLVRASDGESGIMDVEQDVKISISMGGITKKESVRYLVDFTKYVVEESALAKVFESVKNNLDYFDRQVENLFKNARDLMGMSEGQIIRKAT